MDTVNKAMRDMRNMGMFRASCLAGLCLLGVAGNLVGPSIFWYSYRSEVLQHCAFVATGAMIAEVCLLAIWCGLSRQAITVRLPVTMALVLVGACSFCLGVQLPQRDNTVAVPLEAALMVAGGACAMFLVMQVPLWLIRCATRSRIGTPESIRLGPVLQGKQFSIGYLMLWMAFISVLLVIVRNSFPTQSEGVPLRILIEVATFLLIYIVLSSLLCLPCIWIALIERPRIYCALTLVATIIFGPFVVFVTTNSLLPGQDPIELVLGVLCYEIGFAGTTLGVLFAVRFLGYRMLANDALDTQPNNKGNSLDPQVQRYLDAIAVQNRPAWETMPPAESRKLFASFTAAFGEGPQMHRVEDRVIAEHVAVRVYTPSSEGRLPVVVYYHGGGWVLGNLDTHDALCRRLAGETECVVVAVDYRLAPDAKFPAAFDDCLAATSYVSQHADEFNVDPARLVVAGDSAGGNLAAAVAIRAAELGSPAILSQVLLYPVVEPNFETESYLAHAEGFGLSRNTMMWFWAQYLAGEDDVASPYAVPSVATNLHALPPAHFIIAEHDVLLSEGKAYANRLQDAGVPTTMRQYAGMIHGFVQLTGVFDVGRQAISDLAEHLRNLFTK
jgi:acetyl esterase